MLALFMSLVGNLDKYELGLWNIYHELDVALGDGFCDETVALEETHYSTQKFGCFHFARLTTVTGRVVGVSYQHIHVSTRGQPTSTTFRHSRCSDQNCVFSLLITF